MKTELEAPLTTPSGSTSSRCLGSPPCIPVSTYWPGLVALSRTRKSPSRPSRFSASLRLMRPWYHISRRSWSSVGATGARRFGGLGHLSSNTLTPPASCRRRASSNGPVGLKTVRMVVNVFINIHNHNTVIYSGLTHIKNIFLWTLGSRSSSGIHWSLHIVQILGVYIQVFLVITATCWMTVCSEITIRSQSYRNSERKINRLLHS